MNRRMATLLRRAHAGDEISQIELASRFATGGGVVADLEAAVFWYEKASAQGNGDASFNLALMYFLGEGCKRSKKKARSLLKNAEKQGSSDASIALAQIQLDIKMSNGKDTKMQALIHMIRAIITGDSRGLLMISQLLENNYVKGSEIARAFLMVAAWVGNKEAIRKVRR